jgi:hypothetical protein
VLRAIGLTFADLFDGPVQHVERRQIAAYPYIDLDGALVAEKVRLEPKAFRWRVPDGVGYRWGLHGAVPGLYRLPDLFDVRRVFVTEGEKTVDMMRDCGVPATCAPGGAGSWRPSFALDLWRLGARELVVLADNDAPGRTHARQVAASCHAVAELPQEPAAGSGEPWVMWAPADASNVLADDLMPLKVKLVELPGIAAGGDVVDYLLDHSLTELLALVDGWPHWSPGDVDRERDERRRALGRERVRRHRERQREARLRTEAGAVTHGMYSTEPVTHRMYRGGRVTHRTYSAEPVTRNAVTLQDVLLGTSQVPLFGMRKAA